MGEGQPWRSSNLVPVPLDERPVRFRFLLPRSSARKLRSGKPISCALGQLVEDRDDIRETASGTARDRGRWRPISIATRE